MTQESREIYDTIVRPALCKGRDQGLEETKVYLPADADLKDVAQHVIKAGYECWYLDESFDINNPGPDWDMDVRGNAKGIFLSQSTKWRTPTIKVKKHGLIIALPKEKSGPWD